jgi:glyoxylase-like metal-dependent hydrolase (beta-lactamase superfamily II)
VFLEKKQGWLFSGDLYLGERIKFFRADERFAEQIASLIKVLTLDFDTLFCAHNPCLKSGKQKIKNKLQFLEDLYITMGNVSFANMVRSAMASICNP